MRKKTWKRVISLFLAIGLVFSANPVAGSAKAKKVSVKLNKTKMTLKKGKKKKLKLKNPNKKKVKKITWKSSKKKVATVSKQGVVTAKKKGTAVVKAKVVLKSGKKYMATCKVTVPKQTKPSQTVLNKNLEQKVTVVRGVDGVPLPEYALITSYQNLQEVIHGIRLELGFNRNDGREERIEQSFANYTESYFKQGGVLCIGRLLVNSPNDKIISIGKTERRKITEKEYELYTRVQVERDLRAPASEEISSLAIVELTSKYIAGCSKATFDMVMTYKEDSFITPTAPGILDRKSAVISDVRGITYPVFVTSHEYLQTILSYLEKENQGNKEAVQILQLQLGQYTKEYFDKGGVLCLITLAKASSDHRVAITKVEKQKNVNGALELKFGAEKWCEGGVGTTEVMYCLGIVELTQSDMVDCSRAYVNTQRVDP